MPLQIIHQDITSIKCDAIVNPSDCFFSGSGGADMAIHKAAGIELDRACAELKSIDFGEVAVTPGFRLPCKYIIHTMGPVWKGGDRSEATLLRSCYVNALMKAKRLGVESLAFPLISSGTFGFPKDMVLRIAIDAISDFLFTADGELNVFICVIDRNSFELSKEIALKEYLSGSRRFVYEDHALKMNRVSRPYTAGFFGNKHENASFSSIEDSTDDSPEDSICARPVAACAPSPIYAAAPKAAENKSTPRNLADWIKLQDDTFPVLLLKLIDKKGMDDVDCYKKANVHKNVFWKIKNDGKYRPSKQTVIAFAIALELSIEETDALLKSAGFALSHNNLFDMIIEFYITNGMYNIFDINAALYKYDQQLLGC